MYFGIFVFYTFNRNKKQKRNDGEQISKIFLVIMTRLVLLEEEKYVNCDKKDALIRIKHTSNLIKRSSIRNKQQKIQLPRYFK